MHVIVITSMWHRVWVWDFLSGTRAENEQDRDGEKRRRRGARAVPRWREKEEKEGNEQYRDGEKRRRRRRRRRTAGQKWREKEEEEGENKQYRDREKKRGRRKEGGRVHTGLAN